MHFGDLIMIAAHEGRTLVDTLEAAPYSTTNIASISSTFPCSYLIVRNHMGANDNFIVGDVFCSHRSRLLLIVAWSLISTFINNLCLIMGIDALIKRIGRGIEWVTLLKCLLSKFSRYSKRLEPMVTWHIRVHHVIKCVVLHHSLLLSEGLWLRGFGKRLAHDYILLVPFNLGHLRDPMSINI
jgi:hypothetical protein